MAGPLVQCKNQDVGRYCEDVLFGSERSGVVSGIVMVGIHNGQSPSF
jgi:hypothetical protein